MASMTKLVAAPQEAGVGKTRPRRADDQDGGSAGRGHARGQEELADLNHATRCRSRVTRDLHYTWASTGVLRGFGVPNHEKTELGCPADWADG